MDAIQYQWFHYNPLDNSDTDDIFGEKQFATLIQSFDQNKYHVHSVNLFCLMVDDSRVVVYADKTKISADDFTTQAMEFERELQSDHDRKIYCAQNCHHDSMLWQHCERN